MSSFRALVCITTCQRVQYLRRYLPHYARFAVDDPRFSLLVSLDGPDSATQRFCEEWAVPLLHSEEREGVGISKNRVLDRFGDFDHYFFIDDDVELLDSAVFGDHVELALADDIHHFSLFEHGGIRKPTGTSRVAGRVVSHGLFGGGCFNYFTGDGLRRVGGWHPLFARYRRGGHTEHSYRFFRAGLAPAPFNVIDDLTTSCIWHSPPVVTRLEGVRFDEDQLSSYERELIDQQLTHYPVVTLAPYELNIGELIPPRRLAAALDAGERYPLVSRSERRHCRSGLHIGRLRRESTGRRRASALLAAAWNWPGNPELRHTVKTALKQ
jgi:hypothetical protein